jgi:hypothetical protein
MAASTFTNHNRNNMDQLGISNSLLHDMDTSTSSTGPQKEESASMTVVLSLWSTSVMCWRRLTLTILVVGHQKEMDIYIRPFIMSSSIISNHNALFPLIENVCKQQIN